ncbi:MAG: Flp pilus assembly complex ATPase component TadA [Burkholderiaceae bacterium]|nr:Flp pilus assembly complex ATPase component TadA [Burkholderiaceae bacterium]
MSIESKARPGPEIASAAPGAHLGQPGRRLALRDLVPALVADGMLTPDDAQRVMRYDGLSSVEQHPLTALAQRHLRSPGSGKTLDEDALCRWLAGAMGMAFVNIDPMRVDLARVSEVMSSQYAARFKILPLEVRGGEVTIATAEPFVTEWVDELSQLLRKEVKRVIATPTDLNRYVAEFFSLARSVRDASRSGGGSVQQNLEQLVELGRSGKSLDANDAHIVTIVDWLWQYAFEQRASDIHLEPRRDIGVIRFRIDGVMHNVYQLPAPVLAAMTSRIKLLGRMDVVEKRRPQDGRIKTRAATGKEIELRLSTLPTAFGEKMVMRVFDPGVLVRDFYELGFSDEDLRQWQAMTGRPNGIVLVTGPTGSGKTTTLYTTLKELATEEVNVCTVEDPIEMVEPAFNQMQVQTGIDLGFADGVRALMRQDPDIIMIGEIRDLETAEMAIQAALTGHLVLTTLHTNDAPSAITRLIDLGVAPYLLNATLNGVLAQRLVRTLCPSCREPVDEVPQARWREMIRPFKAAMPSRVYRPVGCLDCRMTGYRGRAGLYELLVVDDQFRSLIGKNTELAALRMHAVRHGMRPLRLSGAAKVAKGVTTIDEVLRNAPPVDMLPPAAEA